MSRSEPPFECAGPTPTERLNQAREVLARFRFDDPLRSIADLNDALGD